MTIDLLETYHCKKCDSTDERFQSEGKKCLICGEIMKIKKFDKRSAKIKDYKWRDQ